MPSAMEKDSEQPLLTERDTESDVRQEYLARSRRTVLALRASVVFNVMLLAAGGILWLSSFLSHPSLTCQTIFSPAQDAIEYSTQVFRSGLAGDRTEYQGPTEEVQQRWEDLYGDVAMSQIDEATAKKLPNATAPSSYDHSHYVVQLDVFHTLHCLSILRKRLYPDIYPPDNRGEDGIDHMEHCVESIRQSLQCFSDVSTLYWEWSEKTQRMLGNTKTTHTCRNFEKIKDWAKENSMPRNPDFLVHVPGSPLMKDD